MRLRKVRLLPFGADEEENEEGQEPDSEDQGSEEEQEGLSSEAALAALKAARAEAAKYRKRAQSAEAKVEQARKAEMSELEKAQEAAREADARAAAAEQKAQAMLIRAAVTEAASRLGFHDPADTLPHIDLNELTLSEDGTPDGRSLKAALERLAKDKPYLVKPKSSGSGDGGPKGSGAKPTTWTDRVEQHKKGFESQGLVRIP